MPSNRGISPVKTTKICEAAIFLKINAEDRRRNAEEIAEVRSMRSALGRLYRTLVSA